MKDNQGSNESSSGRHTEGAVASGDAEGARVEDAVVRRLQRENHLLRLQLLRLREDQRSLREQLASALHGSVLPNREATATSASQRLAAHSSSPSKQSAATPPPTAADGAASDVRALTLQRREARQHRMASALASAPGGEDEGGAAASPTAASPSPDVAALLPKSPCPADGRDGPPPLSDGTATSAVAGTDPFLVAAAGPGEPKGDDLSAEAMLQRFHNRKAQRRLRLEQMLGPSYESGPADDTLSGTTPFGKAPGTSPSAGDMDSEAARQHSSSGNATPTAPNTAGEPAITIGHRGARAADAAGAGAAGSTTQNPNQIGRVVTDAVRNNSWYLCKVLEAALLDTVQARPLTGGEAAGPSPSSTAPTSPLPSPDGAAPQLLYQVGVSDTALRRAIEESLVLAYRCVRDAPHRLTSLQAAEEAVPPFEEENKDAELRRCFAGQARRGSAERGGVGPATSVSVPDDDADDADGAGLSAGRAEEDSLDPFAQLLLARLSAELPSAGGKGDKKQKGHLGGSGKHGEEGQQGTARPPFDGGQSFGGLFGKGGSSSGASSGKANTAFVMAAAGGDGKVHIPKKHFSRLDEVQVEMHAPVIFNQIRGFLRLDVDRFRRSFVKGGGGAAAAAAAASREAAGGAAADGAPARGAQPQLQQRRLRTVNTVTVPDEATPWRISVSPGKSGTTLLYFGDYVMKTVRPSELEFFTRKFLPAYVRYCERNPHTLLPRFYALVTVRWWKAGMAQHFVLMHNVFATPYYIHRIYDVKGSTVNRTALQPGKPPPRTAFGALLLKDNDLPPQLIICGPYQRAILLAQFRSDVAFLRQLSVVDYSCMIGVRSRLFSREEGPSKTIVLQRHHHHHHDAAHVDPHGGAEAATPLAGHQRTRSEVLNVTGAAADAGELSVSAGQLAAAPSSSSGDRPVSEDDVYVCIHGCDGGLLSLPIYAPGDDTTAREDVYYLGIIDVLQTYNSAKKLESFAKGFVNDRQAISVIPPEGYAERLYKVIERISV